MSVELKQSSGFAKHYECPLFKAPAQSISSWAIEKIEYYDRLDNDWKDKVLGHIVKRVIVVAMPYFALADVAVFVCKSFKNVKHLKAAGKSFGLFIMAIPAQYVAIFSPTLVYASEKTRSAKLQEKIKNSVGDLQTKDAFTTILEGKAQQYVDHPEKLTYLKSVVQEMAQEIPWESQDKANLVKGNYIAVFARILAEFARVDVPAEALNQTAMDLTREIMRIRKPEVRNTLVENLLHVFQSDSSLVQKEFNVDASRSIALLLGRQILGDETELYEELIGNKYFSDQVKMVSFIATILDLVQDKSLENQAKRQLLEKLLECYKADQSDLAKHQEIEKAKQQNKKKFTGKAGKLFSYWEKDTKRLANLSVEAEKKGYSSDKESQIRQQLLKEISAYEKELLENYNIDPKEQSGPKESVDTNFVYKGAFYHTAEALKNIGLFVAIKAPEFVQSVLKSDELISDAQIYEKIWRSEFAIPEDVAVGEKIQSLRRPDIILTYNCRLKELSGKEKKAAMEALRSFVQAFFAGNLTEVRHRTDNNPHLKRIAEYDPEILQLWQAPMAFPMEQLIQGSGKNYQGFSVVDTEDPCDLVLQGSESGNSCLDVTGRIYKLKGLLGIIADGKTHTIAVKDNKGRIRAKARLLLMWDSKLNKPVLFRDDIDPWNSTLQNDPQHQDFERAIALACEEKAQQMQVEMVMNKYWIDTGRYEASCGQEYEGSVSSLGSAAPFEYVNSQMRTTDGKYTLGASYKIYPQYPVTKVVEGNQNYEDTGRPDGPTTEKGVSQALEKLRADVPEGIEFVTAKKESYITGGNCSAHALDFAADVLNGMDAANAGLKHVHGGGETRIQLYRDSQAAMNCIKVKSSLGDPGRAKMQALANLYDLTVTDASATFDITQDSPLKLKKITESLQDGTYLLRVILPADNDKLEVKGHSMVLTKKGDVTTFFDPNRGVEQFATKWIGDRVYSHLTSNGWSWKITHATFYRVESSGGASL